MLQASTKKIIYKPPRLSRPAVTPTLQVNHVANVGTRMCALNYGNRPPLDLVAGSAYSAGGGPDRFHQNLPTVGSSFMQDGAGGFYELTGLTVETITSGTFAAIMWLVQGRSTGSRLPCLCTNSSSATATGGVMFGLNTTSNVNIMSINSQTEKASSFKVGVSGPIFIAASIDASVSNFVCTNLITGQIQSSTSTGTTFSANDGTYLYGATNQYHLNDNYMSAAMMSNADLTLAQLLTWAQNPWSFWYPV